MAWQDRVQQGSYISPSGVIFNFHSEDVSLEISNKTTAFETPNGKGTYVQWLGKTGKRLPLNCFFNGADHDIVANQFLEALTEEGIGILFHPFYGTFDVVPFGSIKRNDSLVSEANQTSFEVTFYETTGSVYLSPQRNAAQELAVAIVAYSQNSAQKFGDELKFKSVSEKFTFKSAFQAVLKTTKSTFEKITRAQDAVNKDFNNIYNSINDGIDLLIADPIALAKQTNILLQTPSRMNQSIQLRIDGYKQMISGIVNAPNSIKVAGFNNNPNNEFQTSDLYASGSLVAMIQSVSQSKFETKPEALLVAEEVISQFDQINAWREANYSSLGLVDTGAMYQALQNAVALTAGFLVQLSFSLKEERVIVLGRNRTMIDLVAELYGSVDENLDFFINTNNLSGDEYLELKKGREIVYFV